MFFTTSRSGKRLSTATPLYVFCPKTAQCWYPACRSTSSGNLSSVSFSSCRHRTSTGFAFVQSTTCCSRAASELTFQVVMRMSDVENGEDADRHADRADAEHGQLQPSLLGQQRDRSQGNRDLQHGGGLRPAVVLVHLLLALAVPVQGLGLELVGGELDLRLLALVAVDFLGVHRLLFIRNQHQRQLRQVLLAALGLVVVPLVGCFGLLDRGVVLVQAGIGL